MELIFNKRIRSHLNTIKRELLQTMHFTISVTSKPLLDDNGVLVQKRSLQPFTPPQQSLNFSQFNPTLLHAEGLLRDTTPQQLYQSGRLDTLQGLQETVENANV